MRQNQLPKQIFEEIRIKPNLDPSNHLLIQRIEEPREPSILVHFLEGMYPSALMPTSFGVAHQQGVNLEYSGFRYPTDPLDPDEEPFNDLLLWHVDEQMHLEVSHFELLLLHYFQAVVFGAKVRDASLQKQAFWPLFLENIQILKERAQTKMPLKPPPFDWF